MLTKTYETIPAPPPPPVDVYVSQAKEQWRTLLSSDPEETAIQSFLEQNPMFLPGALTPGTRSGHDPLHGAVITQPRLPGLATKIPDFMWIAKHSATWYPTLVEIEKPSKLLFNANGIPTAAFTQARNQLTEWRVWFSKPENVQQFIASYAIPDWFRLGRTMQLHMILVYGRRSEFEGIPQLSEKRSSLLHGSDEELISFDRLRPDHDLYQSLTIRMPSSGRYTAVSVPPLFKLSPHSAERLLAIDGIEDCLKSTPLVSEQRRNFLISRIPYWRNWAKSGSRGVIHSGDEE